MTSGLAFLTVILPAQSSFVLQELLLEIGCNARGAPVSMLEIEQLEPGLRPELGGWNWLRSFNEALPTCIGV